MFYKILSIVGICVVFNLRLSRYGSENKERKVLKFGKQKDIINVIHKNIFIVQKCNIK